MSVLIRLARVGAGQESTKTCCPCLRLDQGVVVIGLSRADVPGGRGLVGRVRSTGNVVQIVVVARLLLDVALLVLVVDLWFLVVVFHGRFSLARAPGPIHWVVSLDRFFEGATGASRFHGGVGCPGRQVFGSRCTGSRKQVSLMSTRRMTRQKGYKSRGDLGERRLFQAKSSRWRVITSTLGKRWAWASSTAMVM